MFQKSNKFQEKDLLTPKEACEYLDGAIRPKTLANWRSTQFLGGPSWYVIGREIRYRKEDLDLFINSRKQSPGEGGALCKGL